MIRRGNTRYFRQSWEILDQAVGDLTRHNRAMPHLANSDRRLSQCKWIEQIEEDRGFGLLS
jgi:hypothetical protein